MEINIRGGDRILEVWLTREEARDRDLRERLRPLYREYRGKNFLVVVFESGEGNLEELTGRLLSCHRRRAIQLEMERERSAAVAE